MTADEEIKSKPDDGCYITGLWLEGARWDTVNACLSESKAGVLFSKMPVVWVRPTENKKRTSSDYFYACPVYRTLARAGTETIATTGQSANYVITVDIPSKEEEKVWIKRGVACVLTLND